MNRTFKNFDKLGFSEFANRLTSFVQTERHFVDGALLVSLNGKFGCGKSTFFEMWREQLESDPEKRFSTILLNAWESDFDRDPLLSIIRGFIDHLESADSKINTDTLKETAGKLGRFALSAANDVAAKLTGVDFQKAGEKAVPRKPGITGKACFEIFTERQQVFAKLKQLLSNAVKEETKPIIVMVDELDRCRPDHAVDFLETIKHIFNIEGLVFVFGIDKVTLTSSVRSLFGTDLDFNEYYRKFVHRNISFPAPAKNNIHQFSVHLVRQYLSSDVLTEAERHNFGNWDQCRVQDLTELISGFSLTPRQIHEVFRLLAHTLNCPKEQASRMMWGWQIGSIFLATLSVAKNEIYHSFGTGRISQQGIADLLLSNSGMMKNERSSNFWSTLICLGVFGLNEQSTEIFVGILKSIGVWGDGDTIELAKKRLQEMSRAYDSFGMDREDSKPYIVIYDRLESVKQFGGS